MSIFFFSFNIMLDHLNDIYSVLDSVYLFFKICGMAPYKRVKCEKKHKFTIDNFDYINLTCVVLLSVIIWNSMSIIIYEEVNRPDLTIHEMLIYLLYTGTCISAIITMIVFMQRNKLFIIALDNMHTADILMKQLRIEVPYTIPVLLTILYVIGCMCAVVAMMLYEILVMKKPYMRIIHEKCSFHLSLLILVIANYHFIGFIALLFLRLRKMNKFIENLEEQQYEKRMSYKHEHLYEKRTIIFIMRTITDLHDQLINCGKMINEVFSVSLLCFIELMTIGFLGQMFSFCSPSHVYSTQTNIAGFIIYALFLLPILIPSEFTMNEANKTLPLMGLLNICYYDKTTATERNTLLLQGLHHRLNLTAGGIHTLCIGVLIKQINSMNTFLIFFLQIQPPDTSQEDTVN